MRGPRTRGCWFSPELPVVGGTGVNATWEGDLLVEESEIGGRLRGRCFWQRAGSPSTSWQNSATPVLLMGRLCRVRRSAMERYEAFFCRSSMIKSLAADNSRNRFGRSGANSETALRTVVGSKEVIFMRT